MAHAANTLANLHAAGNRLHHFHLERRHDNQLLMRSTQREQN